MFAIVAITLILTLLVYHFFRDRNYWLNKGVAQKSKFRLGVNFNLLLKLRSIADLLKGDYDEFVNKRYFGAYDNGGRVLVLRDPELIKRIGIKHFDNFTGHKQLITPEADPLWAKNLLNLKGNEWRHMRAQLSPAFTGSKMRTMFNQMRDCAESFTKCFLEHVELRKEVDTKDAFSRYTNDIIASLVFGVECDSLKNRNNEFFMMGKQSTDFSSLMPALSVFLAMINVKLPTFIKPRLFKSECREFFTNLVDETVKFRERTNFKRQDVIQLLIDASKNENGDRVLTNEDITAHALLFFIGGSDTVSQLLNFLAYELAVNPDVQRKLLKEVDETDKELNGGDITYDALMKMKYLDMAIAETLRKYPPFPFVGRTCRNPYLVQPKQPLEKPVIIGKDDIVWIPIYAIHHDERYYPQPEKFDPERFDSNNKDEHIKSFTYLPFGLGPRSCIASRFALLEAKVLYYLLLRKFEFVVTKSTPIPMEFVKGALGIAPRRPVVLEIKKRL